MPPAHLRQRPSTLLALDDFEEGVNRIDFEVEAQQLSQAMGTPVEHLPVPQVVVTLGAAGCDWIDTKGGARHHVDAPRVEAVDTTGAGDTFTGYLLAGLAEGLGMREALELTTRAGALKVGYAF